MVFDGGDGGRATAAAAARCWRPCRRPPRWPLPPGRLYPPSPRCLPRSPRPPLSAPPPPRSGDNFYALGLCNNHTLPPYNSTCPNATDPTAGTEFDVRFRLTYEDVFVDAAFNRLPLFVIAGS